MASHKIMAYSQSQKLFHILEGVSWQSSDLIFAQISEIRQLKNFIIENFTKKNLNYCGHNSKVAILESVIINKAFFKAFRKSFILLAHFEDNLVGIFRFSTQSINKQNHV